MRHYRVVHVHWYLVIDFQFVIAPNSGRKLEVHCFLVAALVHVAEQVIPSVEQVGLMVTFSDLFGLIFFTELPWPGV